MNKITTIDLNLINEELSKFELDENSELFKLKQSIVSNNKHYTNYSKFILKVNILRDSGISIVDPSNQDLRCARYVLNLFEGDDVFTKLKEFIDTLTISFDNETIRSDFYSAIDNVKTKTFTLKNKNKDRVFVSNHFIDIEFTKRLGFSPISCDEYGTSITFFFGG